MSETNEKVRQVELAASGVYAACKVGNAIDLHKWTRSILGEKIEPPEKLHCTVAYSTKPFDVTKIPDFKPVKLGKNENRRIGRLGNMIVLFLAEDEVRPLNDIWQAFIDQGASWDYPSYVCHISLTPESDLTDTELAGLSAYAGPILLMPPEIEGLRDEEFEVAATLVPTNPADMVLAPAGKETGRNFVDGKYVLHLFTVDIEGGNSISIGVKFLQGDSTFAKVNIFGNAKHKLGVAGVRKLINLIKKRFPSLKTIQGERISGVRGQSDNRPRTVTAEIAALSTKAKRDKIKEIEALIVKYSKTKSDTVAAKLKKQIYAELKENDITREEVGLPPKKTAKKVVADKLPKLTDNEVKMLLSLYTNAYGSYGDVIWSNAHNDSQRPHNLPKTTASGVIASLVKKKLMHSDNSGPTKDHTCGLTVEGQAVAAVLNKTIPKESAEETPRLDVRGSMVLEVKSLIDKYERTSSDVSAKRIQAKIYALMEEHGIQRSEVGLPEKKTAKEKPKTVAKPSPASKTSMMPLSRLPMTPWAMAAKGNKVLKIRFLKELWTILNDEKFAGQMKMPNLNLSKAVKVERFRRRGVWFGHSRRLEINPHVFNNEFALYEVVLHEMCHQAVSEISKLSYREERAGHGPVWASWMVKVGLDPKRFDSNENIDYMTEEDKKDFLDKKEERTKAVENEVRIAPSTGLAAKYFSTKQRVWIVGIIGPRNDQAGKRWVFIDKMTYDGRYMIVPANMFYKLDEVTEASVHKALDEKARVVGNAIDNHKERKKVKRADRKAMRNSWLSDY